MTHATSVFSALPNWEAAADTVIQVGLQAYQRGWLPATSGNLSVRAADGTVAITRTSVDKGALRREDILRQPVGTPLVPQSSAEAALHMRLYADYADIGAVFHVHNLNAVVHGRYVSEDAPQNAQEPLTAERQRSAVHAEIVLEGWDLQKALHGVRSHASRVVLPVFDNTQDIAQLAEEAAARLALPVQGATLAPGYVLAGHGLYAWGRDAAQAWRHLEALDTLLAQVIALAAYAAPPVAIPTRPHFQGSL